ncbi:MAG: lamin tail domain-containing protein [Flavobacteriales bacterium]|nr:lamin tail domain-containing protein [Flavobacteriales bacterium]
MRKILGTSVGVLVLQWGCTKDRTESLAPPGSADVGPGYLKINEFLAKGDAFSSDLGTPSDWVEIYNPHPFEVELKDGLWYLTDDAGVNDLKFQIPNTKIPPKGHLLVWCDGTGNFTGMVHSNFSLSSAGEKIGLFYLGGGEKVAVDTRIYGPQTLDNVSEGRSPDGSENWVTFSTPTPGMPNP